MDHPRASVSILTQTLQRPIMWRDGGTDLSSLGMTVNAGGGLAADFAEFLGRHPQSSQFAPASIAGSRGAMSRLSG